MALIICGWANAADAVEVMSLSLAIPSMEDDPSGVLSGPGARGALSGCIFLGMLLGGLLWGLLGDSYGEYRPSAAARSAARVCCHGLIEGLAGVRMGSLGGGKHLRRSA